MQFSSTQYGLIVALTTVVGFPMSAFSPTGTTQPPRVVKQGERVARPDGTMAMNGAAADFRGWGFFDGADILNANNEHIGDVKDLVIDRGSGRVVYAIVTTNKTLGLGGKTVAIPMESFSWNSEKEKLAVLTFAEDLKAYAEFSDDAWKELRNSGDPKAGTFHERMRQDMRSEGRSISSEAKPETLEGTVRRVDRVEQPNGEELTMVTIEGPQGERRVALGPSWFMGSSGMTPSRGDTIKLSWIPATGQTMYDAEATAWERNNQRSTTYNADGSPAWTQPSYKMGEQVLGLDSFRLVRASELKGAKVLARGQDCGKINDIVFDRSNGRVAFLSIDPNENFLGVADTKRMIPWNVTGIDVNGVVSIDADKAMVLASAETPSDLNTLRNGGAERTYKAFDVQAPSYYYTPAPGKSGRVDMNGGSVDRTANTVVVPGHTGTAHQAGDMHTVNWQQHQALMNGLGRDSERQFTGRVDSIESMDCGTMGRCTVAKVDTDNGVQSLVLCPETDRTPDQLGFRTNELVRFRAVQTTTGEKPVWVVSSYSNGEGKETVLVKSTGKVK